MSYDISIADESFNYTYNLGPIWHDHMPGGLPSLDGKTGAQAASTLRSFWAAIDARHRSYYRAAVAADGSKMLCEKYDAQNGWGSTVGALIFTGLLLSACNRHPRHKVRVS